MKEPLDRLLDEAELTNPELATVLGLDRTSVINKRAGRRAWSLTEGTKLAALVSARLGRRIGVEQIDFAVPEPTAAGKR